MKGLSRFIASCLLIAFLSCVFQTSSPLTAIGAPSACITPAPFVPLPIDGDFNRDCIVNGADLEIWKAHVGETVLPFQSGDADGNCIVDGADFLAWQRNVGKTSNACQPSEPNEPPAPQLDSTREPKNYIRPSKGEKYVLPITLSEPGNIVAEVYTAQGKIVKRLLDADLPAGSHNIEWDGRNSANDLVASDVYLILVQNSGRVLLKKKVVLQR